MSRFYLFKIYLRRNKANRLQKAGYPLFQVIAFQTPEENTSDFLLLSLMTKLNTINTDNSSTTISQPTGKFKIISITLGFNLAIRQYLSFASNISIFQSRCILTLLTTKPLQHQMLRLSCQTAKEKNKVKLLQHQML